MKKNADGQFVGRFNHPIFGKCTLRRDGVVQSARIAPRTSITLSQYAGNARVRNAAALWNVLKPLRLEELFTDVRPYTKIAADANNSPELYGMVKEQKAKGYCTIAPILVSWGEILPVQYDTTLCHTDISIGDNRLNENTLYSDFCRWILENNIAFVKDDRLSLIFLTQIYNLDVPRVKAERFDICLSPDHSKGKLLNEIVPGFLDLVTSVAVDVDERVLTIDPAEKMCAFAFVHSGWRDGKIHNSTQHLVCRFDPWDLQLPLLRDEFKSLRGIISNQPILTRENGALCEKFGYSFNPIQVENQL